jgi:hypothetical protein
MPDRELISRAIDVLTIRPVSEAQQHQAALTVCTAMHRSGSRPEDIRAVLAALDLLATRCAPAG